MPLDLSRPTLTPENARARLGQGDWIAFDIGMEAIFEAARDWEQRLQGIEKPWLCWNMSPEWCLVQQKLVRHVGWTPVVGIDPKYDPPQLVEGAVMIDFNARLQLPQMWMHFPVEFAWLFAPRLAFWHSDLLCRISYMEELATKFEKLPDGEMAAIWDYGGFRQILNYRMYRYWELMACTTRSASRSQFDNACGWWRSIDKHPNVHTPDERRKREQIYYDHGFGVMYWKRNYSGRVHNLSLRRTSEGHCSEVGNKNYKSLPGHLEATRNTGKEMELNYDLEQTCNRLGLQRFL